MRRGGARRVATLLRPALAPEARRRGFAESAVLTDWTRIVGEALATRCQPVQLVFARGSAQGGTLVLHAMGGAALEVQHGAPQLVERINRFFGHPAVARLRIVQAPPTRRVARPAVVVRTLAPAEETRVRDAVDGVAEAGLREALAGLGRAVLAARAR